MRARGGEGTSECKNENELAGCERGDFSGFGGRKGGGEQVCARVQTRYMVYAKVYT